MDISLLSKMIGELVLNNDQVGLPGIGTFVAEIVPASFSDRGYTINPPYRRIVFHPDCLEDELLCAFYCSANEDVDMPTARKYLVKYLSELKTVLLEKHTVTLPGVGRLRTTRDNKIFFIPDEDLDIYPDGAGLEPVSLKTHALADNAPVELDLPRPVVKKDEVVAAPVEPVEEREAVEPEPEEVKPEQGVVEPEPVAASETENPADEIPVIRKPLSVATRVIIGILVTLALLIGTFMLLVYLAPDFIDSILYSEQELEIINSSLVPDNF